MPKFLRPVIGIVAAIAVALAAVLIGMQFAMAKPIATETAPILAPISVDGVRTASAPGDGRFSPVVGEGTIVTPGQDDATPVGEQVQNQIDALNEADGADPADAAETIADSGGSDPSLGSDDPCSPETGEPPADCPDGLHSAIFADTHYGDLVMRLKAKPPHDQADSVFDCAPQTLASGELLFDAMTNIPADVTIHYWPLDGSSPEQAATFNGAAADLSTWNSEHTRTGEYSYTSHAFQHCGKLTGIRSGVTYVASAIALDSFGRTSDPVMLNFSSAPDPTYPKMSAIPLTDSVLYTSVPFATGGNRPVVKAWVVAAGTPADCASYDERTQTLQTIQAEAVFQVSADYMRRNNFVANFDQRVVNIYEVPEGSTVVVCARTFNTSAPSWARSTPTSQQFISLSSPDKAVPVVTVKRVNLQQAVAQESIVIVGTTQMGLYCQGVHSSMSVPSRAATAGSSIDINQVLCDATNSSDYWSAEVGASGNITVSTTVPLGGHTYTNRSILPLSHYGCTGACPTLPARLEFSVPLATRAPYRPIVSCSDPNGCAYPTYDNATGSVDLEVTWVRGNSNGVSRWQVGNVDDTLTPPTPPEAPQLDLSAVASIALSTDGFSATASIPLNVDRHATYRLSLSGDCFDPGAPTTYTGQTRTLGGGTLQTATANVYGLCPDTNYVASLGLTDDAGHNSEYAGSGAAPGVQLWSGGNLRVPFNSIRIDATFSLTSPTGFYRGWWSTGISLSANAEDSTYTEHFTEPCYAATTAVEGITGLAKTVTLPQSASVHINSTGYAITEGLYHGVNHDADCGWTDQHWYNIPIVSDLSYSDLLRGLTLSSSPDAEHPFTLTVHLHAVNLGVIH
jgi:hypothetical protein